MATLQIEDKVLYDIPALSEKIGIGVMAIRRYVRTGKLKAVKVGRKYWIDESDLAKLFTTGTGSVGKRG